jgi:hypothetical protein
MRFKNKLFLPLAIIMGIMSLSFSNFNEKQGNKVEHYSIDQLPASWKSNSSLVRAIDLILPRTVRELKNSIACVGCEAPFSVALLIDSPIILSQEIKELSGKKHSGGYNYECITKFAFKSSLAVYDYDNRGIAKVVVTDPTIHDYTVKKKFNVYSQNGEPKLTGEKYAETHASEIGPNQEELIELAEKRMYRLRDEVEKLHRRTN